MSIVDNDFMEKTPNNPTSSLEVDVMKTPVPYADEELKQTILPSQADNEQSPNQSLMTPNPTFADDYLTSVDEKIAYAPNSVLHQEDNTQPRAEDLQLDFGDDDDSDMPFFYLENEHNLRFPALSADSIDEQKPHSSFQAIGDWLKQAADARMYWNALESFGEDVAQYKWAYDEGKMGEFDASSFGKEALKATARGFTSDNLRMMGNVLSAFGTNIENKHLGIGAMTAGATLFAPEAGTLLKNIGDKFQQYAERVENSILLAPVQTAYNTDPSWVRLANILGQGSAQVLSMGAMAKYLGAAPTYALFAGGGAAQVFNESYDKDANIDTANTLALLSGGTTFAIDKIFNPLPRQIESRAKMTSRMIANEVISSPLREAGTEVLQQLLAENLVRQVGIDDTQDLFDGLVESAIGAIAGTSALMAVDGTAYYAQKSYEDARRRMLLKGVSDEDIELFKKNAMELLQSKPEAFSKVFSYSLEQNLKALEQEALQAKPIERSARKADVRAFRKIYDEMYQRAFQATQDDTKAKITASMVQANIMAFYDVDKAFSPQKILQESLPQIKQMTYDKFKQQISPEAKLLFQFGGVGAKYADFVKLSEAYRMEEKEVNPRAIWAKTGWYHGSDGKWRFEISDANAKLKLDFKVNEDELPKRYWQTYIQKLEELEGREIIDLRAYEKHIADDAEVLEDVYNNVYMDFIDFLDKNYQGHFSFGIDKSGQFSFTDPEAGVEKNIQTQKETVNSQVVALLYSYKYLKDTLQQQDSRNAQNAFIRNKTLKQLLIDRDKFNVLDEDDIELLSSANENVETAETQERQRGVDETRSSDSETRSENFKLAMDKLLNSYRGMRIFNPSLDEEIEVNGSLLPNFSEEDKILAPYIPMLLGRAVFNLKRRGRGRKKKNSPDTYYSYFPIKLDGNRINLRLLVNKYDNGEVVWDWQLQRLSNQEAEQDLVQTSGNVISFDQYLEEQKRRAENLRKTSQTIGDTQVAANVNIRPLDKFYSDEQMKIIRAALEEKSFFNFMSEIWTSAYDEDANVQEVNKFLTEHNAITPIFREFAKGLDKELIREATKRQDAMERIGMHENYELFDDLAINKFYQMYLAGQGDFHKPYFNINYLANLYRQAHIPMSMSDKFFAQPRYRGFRPMYKSLMSDFLDKVYRIYRLHKEIEFAQLAELRDIQAANAFIKQRVDEGDESLRTYWMERQLLLDKKEMSLGDLLDHEELYRQYPDLKTVKVRFAELNNDEGYHFYRDKNVENDVLEIDPKQFDYTNLKDLLMRGAAFAIQMREHFDLGLTPTQRHNFMDRHFYRAKIKELKKLNYLVDGFVNTYLPNENPDDFWIEREVPLPLLDVYKSQSKEIRGSAESASNALKRIKYKDVNFDLLYQKVNEQYENRILDPHERQLGDFAYSALRDLKMEIDNVLMVASRVSSGYYHTAPFPWAGAVSQGDIDVRAMLQRQNYSDWQRTFAFWDDRVRKPQVDKTQLSYSALHKFTDGAERKGEFVDFDPERITVFPEDADKAKKDFGGIEGMMMGFARGAYEIADKTIYLFENADEKTIIHEGFHYLSELLKTSQLNENSYLRQAYNSVMDRLYRKVMKDYKLVKSRDGYRLFRRQDTQDDYLPDIPRRFLTSKEAVDDAVEELFANVFFEAVSNRKYPGDKEFDAMFYFYGTWLNKVSDAVVLDKKKYSPKSKKLLDYINQYLSQAWARVYLNFK